MWAMVLAVWAMLVLGATTPIPHDALCGTGPATPAHHAPDCLDCCPCTVAGTLHALAAPAATLPPPHGASLGLVATHADADALHTPALPARARGPPRVA